MGLRDLFFSKKEPEEKKEEAISEKEESESAGSEEKGATAAKYSDKACAYCGRDQTEKKWAGQYWHKKCYRMVRKGAKKMI